MPHVFDPFPVCVCDLFVWIPHCDEIFKVGAHHRHVSHCFCFLAADSEVMSQEFKHAVGLFSRSYRYEVSNQGYLIDQHLGIVRPVKRDWAVLSKDTPLDISI